MIDFSNGPLITPERIVILSVFCVGIPGSCEDLVPERGVAVRVRNTVRWLYSDREHPGVGREGHAGCEHHLLTVTVKGTVIRAPSWRQGKGNVYLFVGFLAWKSNLMPYNGRVQMGDIARVPSKGFEWVQGESDCNWDVNWAWILQGLWGLGGHSGLPTGHCAFQSCGVICEMLQCFILWYTQVQIIKPQQKSIPILCHFWWLNLLDFEEVAQGQEGYCHGADTDHKDHQRRPTADVQLQVLQGVDVKHYSDQLHPAPAGSGAPRAQPGQLLGGRPWPLRVHSRWRSAGPGPLGTILPAAPGAVSGSAGPMRGPEASPAHAAASRVSQGPAAEVSW